MIPRNADSAVGTPDPIDHSLGNRDSVVYDVALSHHEHAVDRHEPVGVDANLVR